MEGANSRRSRRPINGHTVQDHELWPTRHLVLTSSISRNLPWFGVATTAISQLPALVALGMLQSPVSAGKRTRIALLE